MGAMILAGMILCLAMLLTMARMDLLKFLGYATFVDVVFTVIMFEMFAGTFMGIVAGAVSGLCMTSMLYVLKYTLGYKRLTLKGWVYYPPKSVQRAESKLAGLYSKWCKVVVG